MIKAECKRCHKLFEMKSECEKFCEVCWYLSHGNAKTKEEYFKGYNKETKKWD